LIYDSPNRIDTVRNWERNRNNIIDSFYQHNRNPFIDHPESAEYLWGDSIGLTWMPTLVDTNNSTSINQYSNIEFMIYPNPIKSTIHIKATTNLVLENVTIYTSEGVEVLSDVIKGEDTEINLEGLPDGMYFISIGDELKQHFRVLKI
jgi:hypothetical protein